MTAYQYEGMDNSGNEEHGFLEAESQDEATAKLKERGLFVTKLAALALEVTPEWSGVSLVAPSSIPTGRLLPQGLPCTHEQRGMAFDGSLNVAGVGGDLYLIFDRPGSSRPELELPIRAITQLQRRGLIRKSLVVTTDTWEEHIFRGAVAELQRLCEWAMFVGRKAK